MRNIDHNYDPKLASANLIHRKIAKTEDVLDQITNHAKTGAPQQQILTDFRFNHKSKNLLIKSRDVYNKHQQIRKRNLERLTPIQCMIRTLFDIATWFVRYYSHSGPVEHFFFASQLSERILKISWNVILLDFTYKTNHYRMPLCVIFGVTSLNTSVYIRFAFVFFWNIYRLSLGFVLPARILFWKWYSRPNIWRNRLQKSLDLSFTDFFLSNRA